MNEALYADESYKIVGTLFDIYNELGFGYQEKYYYRAIKNSLIKKGFKVVEQLYVPLVSDGKAIGGYYLDFLINDCIILEIKVADSVYLKHIKQVHGYLIANKLKLGIIGVFSKNGVLQKRVVNLY